MASHGAVADVRGDLANLAQGEGVELAVGRVPFGGDAASTLTAMVHSPVGLVGRRSSAGGALGSGRSAPLRATRLARGIDPQSPRVSSRLASRSSSASSRCMEMSATRTSSSSLPAALVPSSIMM